MNLQFTKIVTGLYCLIFLSHLGFSQVSEDYIIESNGQRHLPSVDLSALKTPIGKLSTSGSSSNVTYQVMQFQSLPTSNEKKALEAKGIAVLNYIGSNAYYVSIDYSKQVATASTTNIRTVFRSSQLNKVATIYTADSIPEEIKSGDLKLKSIVHVVRSIEHENVLKEFRKREVFDVQEISGFNMYKVNTTKEKLEALNDIPWVTAILPPAPERKTEDYNGQKMHGLLNAKRTNFGHITGNGVNIGIWDGDVDQHIDLGDRVTVQEAEYKTTNHGMHVTGIVGGAGVIDQYAQGFATQASFETWNFNMGSNGMMEYQEMDESATNAGISITQNSYGMNNTLGVKFPYGDFEYGLDLVANNHPNLLHVFAAGNSRGYLGVYNTVSNSAKNIISVANIDIFRNLNWSSSFGPGHYGVLVPHISAHGTDVLSLSYYDEYTYMTGTSMSCPAVSGSAALLIQAYDSINNAQPESALLKGILCNSADDLYIEGPDYYSGFGELNVEKALNTVVEGKFFDGTVEQDEEVEFNFVVPSNQKEVKIMLTWLDPESVPTQYGTLINDLDIEVVHNGITYEPLVLDKFNPDFKAKPGKDRINNIEQVVIKTPTSGRYTIKVKGYQVAEGPQKFFVNYVINENDFEIIYPEENETLVADAATLIRWRSTNMEDETEIYYSEDGLSFEKVATAQAGRLEAIIEPSSMFTNEAKLRLVQGSNVREINFSQMHRMETPIVTEHGNFAEISWNNIQGARAYQVLKYNGFDYEVVTTVDAPATKTDIYGATRDGWYAVRAVDLDQNIIGKRSKASQLQTSSAISGTTSWPIELTFENEADNEWVKKVNNTNAQTFVGNYDTEFFNSKTLLLTGKLHYKNGEWVDSELPPSSEGTAEVIFDQNPDFITSGQIEIEVPSTVENPTLSLALTIPTFYPKSAYFRVKVNGNVIADATGQSYFYQLLNRDENAWYGFNDNVLTRLYFEELFFNLSAYKGETITIDLEGVCRSGRAIDYSDNYGSEVKIDYVKFYDAAEEASISFKNWSTPKSGLGAVEETLSMSFVNTSATPISSAKLAFDVIDQEGTLIQHVEETYAGSIGVNEGVSHTFATPMQLTEIDKSYNITYSVAFGEEAFMQDHEGVDRYDGYFRAGSRMYNNMYFPPRIDGMLEFTTDGGKIYPYSANQGYGLVMEAKNAGQRIQFDLKSLDLAEGDTLFILDGYYSSFNREKIVAEYAGNEFDDTPLVSSAVTGAMTIIFFSGENEEGHKGFVYEVKEVQRVQGDDLKVSNIYNIGEMYKYHSLTSNLYPVHFQVSNNGSEEATAFTARYFVNDELKAEEHFTTTIPASYYGNFMFEHRLDPLTAGEELDIRVEVLDEDINMENNVYARTQVVANSERPSTMPDMFVSKVSMGDYYFNENDGEPDQYFTNENFGFQDFEDRIFDFTYGQQKELEVILSGPVAGAGYPVTYVDWNDDGFFSAEEKMIMHRDPAYEHRFYGYIKPETVGAAAGLKKIRISLQSEAFLGLEVAQEYRINLEGEPFNQDIALDYIDTDSYAVQFNPLFVKVGAMQFIHDEVEVDLKLSLINSNGTEVYTETEENFKVTTFGEHQFFIPGEYLNANGQIDGVKYTLQAEVIHPEDGVIANNTKTHEITVMQSPKFMYGTDGYAIYRWPTNNPGKRDRLQFTSYTGPRFISSAYVYNFNSDASISSFGQLIGLTEKTDTHQSMLYKVDMNSGIYTPFVIDVNGFEAAGIFDIAFDSFSSKLYGIALKDGNHSIYEIDLSSGDLLLVNQMTMLEGGRVAGFTFDFDGTCYLLDGSRSELQTLDLTNGECALFHKFEETLSYSQGIAFDRSNGQLYIHSNTVDANEQVTNIYYRFDFQERELISLYTFNDIEARQIRGMTFGMNTSSARIPSGLLSFHIEGEHKTVISDNVRIDEVEGAEGGGIVEVQQVTTYLPSDFDVTNAKVFVKSSSGGFMASHSSVGKLDWGKTVNLNIVRDSRLVSYNNFNNSQQWEFNYELVDANNNFLNFDLLTSNNIIIDEDINGDIQGETIYLSVATGVSIESLIPSFTVGETTEVYINGELQESGLSVVDFTDGVVYRLFDTLTEEEKVYVVRVLQEQNTEAELLSFEISPRYNGHLEENYVAVIDGQHVALNLIGVDQQDQLVPSFTLSTGAFLEYRGDRYLSGDVPFDFTEMESFVIVSEDLNTRQEYTLDVRLSESGATELVSFAILSASNSGLDADINFEVEGTQIKGDLSDYSSKEWIVDYEVSEYAQLKINGEFVDSGVNTIDFNTLTSLVVVAENGEESTYTTDIKLEKSALNTLVSFSILSANNEGLSNDIEFAIDGNTITGDLSDYATKTFVASFEVSPFASLLINGEIVTSDLTAINFAEIVSFAVIAEDLTANDFDLDLKLEKSTEADLLEISILKDYNQDLASDIHGEIREGNVIYFDFTETNDITSVKLNYIVSENADLFINNESVTSNVTTLDVQSLEELVVVAEDGTEVTYTIEIEHQITSINDLFKAVKLYPNPTLGGSKVTIEYQGRFEWSIVNLLGQTLLAGEDEHISNVNIQSLNTGTYIVILRNENGQSSYKFIKN